MDMYWPVDTKLVSNVAREDKRIAHPWSKCISKIGFRLIQIGLGSSLHKNYNIPKEMHENRRLPKLSPQDWTLLQKLLETAVLRSYFAAAIITKIKMSPVQKKSLEKVKNKTLLLIIQILKYPFCRLRGKLNFFSLNINSNC